VVKGLEAKRTEIAKESRALWRRLQPVTVLVSRQTGRVHVRQAFNPVIDLPVSIRDPSRPLGTHVFTAFDSGDKAGNLDWRGITIETPGGGVPVASAPEPDQGKRSTRGQKSEPPPRAPVDVLASARAALDRLSLPPEAMARILPSLQPGSTLIISDYGPSIETGPGTDIVVQTKGEQQAAENIARFLARKKAELAMSQGVPEPPRRGERGREGRRTGDWQRW
jgi:hypothetical protein